MTNLGYIAKILALGWRERTHRRPRFEYLIRRTGEVLPILSLLVGILPRSHVYLRPTGLYLVTQESMSWGLNATFTCYDVLC
jgi:hypothetical protein